MSNELIKTIQFREEVYPEVVRIANELAQLEQRKPHDSIKMLIEEAGREKIDRLKAQSSRTSVAPSKSESNK